MSDRTTELMRLCFERIDLLIGREDAVFFQNVMNALFETRHESGCRARLDEIACTQFCNYLPTMDICELFAVSAQRIHTLLAQLPPWAAENPDFL